MLVLSKMEETKWLRLTKGISSMKDKLFWNPIKLIKKQEGTTLIELIVAIAILSIVVTSFLIFYKMILKYLL
ncbi:prepilin-type N-terminal cleavage/methylation domain-containing protein [Marinilactibacillus psychrotolerans]